ncbi:hypothetical protein ACCO45_001971 [Purpureocillium lilacinum]|uniref:Uncharacterized protein n=1 Tax=Purpureocillium lilacinum TaxID=33203 RepID=A0ACC4E9V4_PURLI
MPAADHLRAHLVQLPTCDVHTTAASTRRIDLHEMDALPQPAHRPGSKRNRSRQLCGGHRHMLESSARMERHPLTILHCNSSFTPPLNTTTGIIPGASDVEANILAAKSLSHHQPPRALCSTHRAGQELGRRGGPVSAKPVRLTPSRRLSDRHWRAPSPAPSITCWPHPSSAPTRPPSCMGVNLGSSPRRQPRPTYMLLREAMPRCRRLVRSCTYRECSLCALLSLARFCPDAVPSTPTPTAASIGRHFGQMMPSGDFGEPPWLV